MDLHQKLLDLVKTERRVAREILVLIHEVEARSLHLEMGYPSIFSYLTKGLGYCESSAYRRMQAARLLREIPAVSEKLVEGTLSLTQLSKLQGAAKNEPFTVKKNLLAKIENKTKAETEKILAEQFPAASRKKAISYTREGHINLTLRLSSEQFNKLRELQALSSHSAQTLEELFEKFLETEVERRTKIKNLPKVSHRKGRIALNTNLKKVLFEQNNYECQYTSPSGKKCEAKYFLEIEHKKPLALGGSNQLENLTVLCRAHNQFQARKLGL